jgi:predicted double-glycine peptidase
MFHSRHISRSIATALTGIMLTALPAQAGDIHLGGGGGEYEYKVKSLADSRFRNVVKQKFDFSCGSAALATMLTYHYDQKVGEMDVLKAMIKGGDLEKIHKEGFSLLDMKNYLVSLGYQAEGFRESLDKLERVGIPAIVLINRHGYMHFVVVKGVTKDKVSVGDPTLGLRIYERDEFEKMWNGILFVILDNKPIAQAYFNTVDTWTSHGNPKFRNMLEQGELSRLTMDTALTPNYY